MSSLVEVQGSLRAENQRLREELERRGRKLQDLDARLLEGNQSRQDAIKRIDELIARVELLAEACGRQD